MSANDAQRLEHLKIMLARRMAKALAGARHWDAGRLGIAPATPAGKAPLKAITGRTVDGEH
ncbi:hypothetical protein W911_11540 [Hyphomicrobium nitrativorans NL23]|uniref:Uncharacterized protein n=1 Tax=Hyphomicrobium nitrativorans NL23 TaxID=1029756 RepID=V5SI56_9HYPH|nr:hypothetical protein W911_11540 [Hyphomicrobium nitrativorans NL23]